MEQQDTLTRILRVEEELREQLDAQRAQAAEWLAEARREADQAHERELEALKVAVAAGDSASVRSLRDEAETLLREARVASRRAGRLRPADLQPLVRQHLAGILPGGTP